MLPQGERQSCIVLERYGAYNDQAMDFGKRLRDRREEIGLSQEGLARLLGVTYQCVQGWERERTCPRTTTLPNLVQALGVTSDWLLGIAPVASRHSHAIPPHILEALQDVRMQRVMVALCEIIHGE